MQPYSLPLQNKIDRLKSKAKALELGSVKASSPLLLAPMSAICNAPFRLLMEELGAGLTVSELISCHGINYNNQKTKEMLRIDRREKNVGIQLFGEEGKAMAQAALVAQSYGARFIDINMGCPVRKVVGKGAGSALLKELKSLPLFLREIKKELQVPLTIKIRLGWDDDSLNAKEILSIAHGEGVEFVAIHGRTRAQQYKGHARWDDLESLAKEAPLPVIGNGDLHTSLMASQRLQSTNCQALMLGRGPLRNPFIFLESLMPVKERQEQQLIFTGPDYAEILSRYYQYLQEYCTYERAVLTQYRKMAVWFSSGLTHGADFRGHLFSTAVLGDITRLSEDYFMGLEHSSKQFDESTPFMAGGHG